MNNKYLNLGIVLTIAAIGLLINSGSYGVVETSDARYAEIAREMFLSGDYIHPNLLNIHHYHKPPFTYQITALGYALMGIHSFAARFFLQLSVLLQIWLVYKIALLLFEKKKTALLSAAIYFSFPMVLISSRNLTTDSFLTSFVLLSIYTWLEYYKNGKVLYLYFFALSMGLGFYTKGPVIFIFVPVFMIIYSLFFSSQKKARRHYFSAFLLFLITGLWWYLYLAVENEEFVGYFLGKQTVDRFSRNVFNRAEPWWYFLVLAPATAIPWSLLLPFMIKQKWHEIKKDKRVKVLVLSILIPLLFLSLSTSKRILYILPFYGFLAILTAYLIGSLTPQVKKRYVFLIGIFYGLLSLAVLCITCIDNTLQMPAYGTIFSFIILLTIFYILYRKKDNPDIQLISLSMLFGVFMLIISGIFMAANPLKINSPVPLTDFIKKQGLDAYNVYVYNTRKPSIAFELNKPIISIYKDSRDLNREVQFEPDNEWKNYLINLNHPREKEALINQLSSKKSIFITYKEKRNTGLDSLIRFYSHKKLFGPYTLYYK
jgi:4-amino-4-deoxy-L-arabinose transferase